MAYYRHFTEQSGDQIPDNVQEDNEQGSAVPLLEPIQESDANVIEQSDNTRERQLETTRNTPVHGTASEVSEMNQGLPIPRDIPLSSSPTEGALTINDNTLLHPIMPSCCQVSPHLSEQRDDNSQ